MVSITNNGSEIIIAASPNHEIFKNYILVKQLARSGFVIVQNNLYKCETNIRAAVVALIKTLSARGIKYSTTPYIQELFDSYGQELSNLENAKVGGLKARQIDYDPTISIAGFKRQLFPYQAKAVNHMINVYHPANFSVPGSGKTTMAYAFFQHLKNQGIVDKMLVIGPLTSFKVWEEEMVACISGFTDKDAVRLNGPGRHDIFNDSSYTVYITNYHLLPRDKTKLIEHIQNTGRYLIVVDEAHYIKNPEDGIIKTSLLEIAPFASRRLIATGTPCPNSLMDLHSQFSFLWPSEGVTGSKHKFETFILTKPLVKVRETLKPFFYRIQKEELKLNEPDIKVIQVSMNPLQQEIYDAILNRALAFINRLNKNDQTLRSWRRAWSIRLNQVMSNPSLLSNSDDDFEPGFVPSLDAHIVEKVKEYYRIEIPSKIQSCCGLLEELQQKGVKKVVVWTNFKKNVTMLEPLFANHGWTVKSITGDVPNSENALYSRDCIIQDFKDTDKPAILLATPASCAEAVSLHKHCHDMIFLDITFNAAHWMQAKDRIHRIGMASDIDTNYYVFQAKNTYDKTIFDRVIRKEAQMKAVCNCDLPVVNDEEEISFDDLIDNNDKVIDEFETELEKLRLLLDA
ncbi:RNA helicase [Sporomusaceae bacterium FL31]|nr:RNA helicase [Sporomusaceae bacterium FL31]GCE32794.1 RNA helicase [Sporomusaceae bacterium]